jgi:FAD/FMN-containing dehydrogenase/Fe-S oxidoreductase
MHGRPPNADDRAGYDYQSNAVERPDLAAALRARVDGDVRFDSYSKLLYSTDASLYEVTPIGVVCPRSTDDVAAVMAYCASEAIPVLPRGAGTSLGGQTVNEAVVLDFSRYMTDIVSTDPDGQTATVQPGVTLGSLNETLAEAGLKFAPDPAWGDKSVIGGAIGNNSTGAHSLQYGKTDAYVEACEVVLADGTVTRFGEVALADLPELAAGADLESRIYAEVARILDEEADLIEAVYPDLKRNVSGYNLDWLVEDIRGAARGVGEPDGTGETVNLAKLLCGSEGTLAIVTEATVSLEPVPETKSMALLSYEGLLDAVDDVSAVLEHDPAAVEVLDDVLLDLARETAEFAPVTEMLPAGTEAALIVEFYAESDADGRQTVANLLADRCPEYSLGGDADGVQTGSAQRVVAFDALEAHGEDERARIWKLRKSAMPILLSRTTDEKHASFIEDTAVPPENLREFVAEFQEILEEHDTYATFYAHAGPGVLHIRPLVNTKTGHEQMESIADAATDLVVKYDGSVSGEHGDGRARTQWNRKLYGGDLWETFRQLKTAFDPDWLLNPGQIVYREDDPTRMTENHRVGPDREVQVDFDPTLSWETENGVAGMVELCHGCGGCRGDQSTTGGVMCPTYRASQEEITTTRGRANALRRVMTGDLGPDEAVSAEFLAEVLDLCIGCKGCAHDCPSEVDMAKLKAELTHEAHQRNGASLRDRLFARVHTLSRVGSALAPLSNLATSVPGSRHLLEWTLGIARKRPLPTFHRRTFRDWFEAREQTVSPAEADRTAALYPDTFTDYSNPDAGKAAVRVLEAANVHVTVPVGVGDTGRPAFSKGFLDRAGNLARENVDALAPLVETGCDIVVVEPSDAVMLQSDYRDLLSGTDVEAVADNTYGVCEYLDTFGLDESVTFEHATDDVTYHGHCHQKATAKDHHAVGVLRRAGYAVDPLDSGCCGMAGSFGYEAEHASMSDAIASILFDQVEDSAGERVVAPGASCRTQFEGSDRTDGKPQTPIEAVADALAE